MYPTDPNEYVVVHLGNVGYRKKPAEKTIRLAKRFSQTKAHFYGIDLKEYEPDLENFTQMHEDWISGLEQFTVIHQLSSDMALGFYDRTGYEETGIANRTSSIKYTTEVLNLIWEKLAPGSKAFIRIRGTLEYFFESLESSVIPEDNYCVDPLSKSELESTLSLQLGYYGKKHGRFTITKPLHEMPQKSQSTDTTNSIKRLISKYL